MTGRYFSSPSGGPCWTRDRGYHTPAPMPAHIMRIITAPRDSDGSPKGEDAPAAEFTTARAEGIAKGGSHDH